MVCSKRCAIVQVAWPFCWFLPLVVWALNRWRPGNGGGVLVPSQLLRYLTFKLTLDLQQLPALQVLGIPDCISMYAKRIGRSFW